LIFNDFSSISAPEQPVKSLILLAFVDPGRCRYAGVLILAGADPGG